MHRQIAGRLTGPVSKWVVVAVWVLALMVAGPLAGKLSEVQNNEQSSWLPQSAESTQALERMDAFQSPNVFPTVLVYEARGGQPLGADALAAIKGDVGRFARLPELVAPPAGPLVSKDGRLAQVVIQLDLGKNGWNKMPGVAKRLRSIGADTPSATFSVAGIGGHAADSSEAFGAIDGTLLYVTLLVVVLILLVTYRSPILWLLPLISAGVALTVAQGVVYLAAKHAGLTVNGQTQAILLVLVLGAGTDYALLLVARYREELHEHEDRHEAMAFALHRAGPAILASGTTVILGMLCLLLAEMNSTAGLGPVCAIGILVALLVMTTLLPALLVVCGRWVFWPRVPRFEPGVAVPTGFWARVGERIAPRPRMTWIVTAAALAVCAVGLVALDTGGVPADQQYTKPVESVRGDRALARHGMIDTSEPLRVMTGADRAAEVRSAVGGVKGTAEVAPAVVRGDTAMIAVTLTDPATSDAAFRTVDRVRSAIRAAGVPDTQVGGMSAVLADVATAASRDNKVVLPAILLVVMLVLVVLLRALVAPLILIATVVLSFAAALGVSALVFKYVFGFAAVDQAFPLFAFVFLVALGIDYNIFLMTRVREEAAEGRPMRDAALAGLAATGGVITSAGIVLAATFGALGTMPVVFVAELAFTIAFGVLLDTLIVRSVLVTSLNLDVGERMWWPSRLARRNAVSATATAAPDAVS